MRCCGSELIFFRFRSNNFFFRIRILRLTFWPSIFLNFASCFHRYVFWNLYVREKKFSIEKHKIFLFQVFDLLNKFSFYNSVGIRIRTFFRIRIQPKHSDSFGFGSTTLGQCFYVAKPAPNSADCTKLMSQITLRSAYSLQPTKQHYLVLKLFGRNLNKL
jgi:hypothetical protein